MRLWWENRNMAPMADVTAQKGLGEIIHRSIYFPEAFVEVTIPLVEYSAFNGVPDSYSFQIVNGNRHTQIRKGTTDWDINAAYFISNTAGVYADVVLIYP